MDIKSLGDLGKIIALCRKKGVESIEIDGIKLKLSDAPPVSRYRAKKESKEEPIKTNVKYSEEDVLLWSSTGAPGE